MGFFNDSYNVADGLRRVHEARSRKEEAKVREKAKQEADKKAQKSNIEKAKDDNLFI